MAMFFSTLASISMLFSGIKFSVDFEYKPKHSPFSYEWGFLFEGKYYIFFFELLNEDFVSFLKNFFIIYMIIQFKLFILILLFN